MYELFAFLYFNSQHAIKMANMGRRAL